MPSRNPMSYTLYTLLMPPGTFCVGLKCFNTNLHVCLFFILRTLCPHPWAHTDTHNFLYVNSNIKSCPALYALVV